MDYLKSFLCEPGTKEGSSQRLCLFLLLTNVMLLVTYLTYLNGKLPEVPPTLQTLLQWAGSILGGGILLSKVVNATKEVKLQGGTDAP